MSVKKAPTAPPPVLVDRKDALDAQRAAIFPKWKTALEATDGNIMQMARNCGFEDEGVRGRARNKAMWMVRRLGLAEYAAELRKAAQGKSMGRPKKS